MAPPRAGGRALNPKTPNQVVYSGRELVGHITNLDAKPIAWDADGKRLGRFTSRAEAINAIMAAHRQATPSTGAAA